MARRYPKKSSLVALLCSAAISVYPISSDALSQQNASFDACMNDAAGVSSEMLACGKAEISLWDARLNKAYAFLLIRLSPSETKRLRNDQRKWLELHNSEIRRLAENPENGSSAFLESQAFELEDLSQRVLMLESRAINDRSVK